MEEAVEEEGEEAVEEEEEEEEIELPPVNLTPPADGLSSSPPYDHQLVVIQPVTEIIPEFIARDHAVIEEVLPETIAEHHETLHKEDLSIADVALPAMNIKLEDSFDNEVSKEVHEVKQVEEEDPDEPPELKLDIPEPFVEFEPPETPKSYMDDGEEIREMRPGFKDIGNCKRFWKANQLMGTRKQRCDWLIPNLTYRNTPINST